MRTLNIMIIGMVERLGRKAILIGGALGQAACMLAVSLVGTLTPTTSDGGKSTSVSIAIVFLLFLFIVFYKPSWGATVWVYSSEIFSMQTRAAGVAMASQVRIQIHSTSNLSSPCAESVHLLDSKCRQCNLAVRAPSPCYLF